MIVMHCIHFSEYAIVQCLIVEICCIRSCIENMLYSCTMGRVQEAKEMLRSTTPPFHCPH